MSTSEGTVATGVVTADVAAKAAETVERIKGEADQAKADKALVSKLTAALKAAENSITKLTAIIIEAKESELHKRTIDPATGRAFTSFAKFLKAQAEPFPLMHKTLRDAVITDLLAAGVGVNEIAAATGASAGTVSNVKTSAERAARPNDGTEAETDPEAAGKLAARRVAGLKAALQKVNDSVADMTDQELDSVVQALTETGAIVGATIKLRKQEASKTEAKAQAPKAQAPKVTPATVAAQAPKVPVPA